MHSLIKNTGVKNIEKHIAETVRSAKLQLKNHSQPIARQPSWKPPKPSETDYQKSDETPLASAQVVKLSGNDINWDMFNWNLLSELDKDEIRHRKILREL